jgi:hypothetical protein
MDNNPFYRTCSLNSTPHIMRVFDSVVAVVFQITFRTEMHVNDVFLIF